MIEAVLWGLLGGGGVALAFQAKLRRAKAQSAAEDPDVITMAVKGLAGKQRWRHGRMRTTVEHLTWQPWLRVGSVLPLPADLRPVGQRRPRVVEMWTMNPRVVIIECQSSTGGLSLGVMPWDVDQVQGLLHRNRARSLAPARTGNGQPSRPTRLGDHLRDSYQKPGGHPPRNP